MDYLKREYPTQPIVGVGAVIICNGKILLAKRGSKLGKNKWSILGGLVELGETVHDTTIREVKEETNLDVEAHSLIDVVDNLEAAEKDNNKVSLLSPLCLSLASTSPLSPHSDGLNALKCHMY